MLWFSVALLPISLLPKFVAMAGNYYLGGALILGAIYIYASLRSVQDCSVIRARQVLLASVLYLPFLYGLLVLDRIRS